MTPKPASVDAYIKTFPAAIQSRLQQIRTTIQKAAPKAVETIKYNMPTFVADGNLVHFAAFNNHIGFYPVPQGHKDFEKDLAAFKMGKGSAQFQHDEPLPLKLIARIVKYRMEELAVKKSVGK